MRQKRLATPSVEKVPGSFLGAAGGTEDLAGGGMTTGLRRREADWGEGEMPALPRDRAELRGLRGLGFGRAGSAFHAAGRYQRQTEDEQAQTKPPHPSRSPCLRPARAV